MNTHPVHVGSDDDSISSIDSRIAATEKLINNLSEAEESADQYIKKIRSDLWRSPYKRHENRDGMLIDRIDWLLQWISFINKIPSHGMLCAQHCPYPCEPKGWLSPLGICNWEGLPKLPTTAKEPDEPIRKLRFQACHNTKSKGLAAERKMIKVLQEQEREFGQFVPKLETRPPNIKYSDKQLKSIVKEFAEKIEYIGDLLLYSFNLWEANKELENLDAFVLRKFFRKKRRSFQSFTHVDQPKLKQYWNSLKNKKKREIEFITYDAVAAMFRHNERYTKFDESLGEEEETLELEYTREEERKRDCRVQKVEAYDLLLHLLQRKEKKGTVRCKLEPLLGK